MAVELSSSQSNPGIWQSLRLFLGQDGVVGKFIGPGFGLTVLTIILLAAIVTRNFEGVFFAVLCLVAPACFGVLMAGAVWWRRQFDKLTSVPRVFATSDILRRGDEIEVDFQQTFKQDSEIVTLKVQLVLQEWVRYTQGTNTYTDTRDIVIDEDWIDHEAVFAGQEYQHTFKLRVPDNAMHTWEEGHNNRLRWYIKVDEDLPGWLDFRQRYKVSVRPEVTNAVV